MLAKLFQDVVWNIGWNLKAANSFFHLELEHWLILYFQLLPNIKSNAALCLINSNQTGKEKVLASRPESIGMWMFQVSHSGFPFNASLSHYVLNFPSEFGVGFIVCFNSVILTTVRQNHAAIIGLIRLFVACRSSTPCSPIWCHNHRARLKIEFWKWAFTNSNGILSSILVFCLWILWKNLVTRNLVGLYLSIAL
jgi:hypothetical protein